MMGRATTARRDQRPAHAELDDLTLRRAQQGERGALDQLVERYHPMVHALVWRMACAQGMDIESGLFTALGRVAGWKIAGQNLELLDSGNAVVARFQATK